jgi:hypothetical protein
VTWTDTLNDSTSSSLTLAASDLYLSSPSEKIAFTAFTLNPGTPAAGNSGSCQSSDDTGSTPSAGSGGALTGTDTTPGTTQSSAVTLANASSTTEGCWTQANTISINVPASDAGYTTTMTSTLTYTITG